MRAPHFGYKPTLLTSSHKSFSYAMLSIVVEPYLSYNWDGGTRTHDTRLIRPPLLPTELHPNNLNLGC